ncbi:hypothetical protein B0H66DRAFT_566131 [Apodospora peruviana]|uniref:Small ribosomal subunit protein uS10m n=1 Tax=Apodospora peruviana TaxID=516989 RepID=A0AAE0LZA0_9PEZI|nr:hypothetical protein B0H66DRAFT_566131 [Apodospora peruviana]
MNQPPLIRPLRSFLQGRLQFATARPAAILRPSIHVRGYASTESDGPVDATVPKAEAPKAEATPVVAEIPKVETKPVAAEKPVVSKKPAVAEKVEVKQQDKVAPENATPTDATAAPAEAPKATTAATPKNTKAAQAVVHKKQEPAVQQKAELLKPAIKRMPRALEALYLQPLRREAEFGVPTCDLQIRSYSLRNLEFFCDFALRAAYYLKLPAFGPVPLPKMTSRWTVPRSVFVHKKSQENFERITVRRLIQIRDGHPETVQIWLAFLQKHAYFGVGMKANIFEFSPLDVGKAMDESVEEVKEALDEKFKLLGQHKKVAEHLKEAEDVEEFLASQRVLAHNGPGGRLDL